MLRRVNVPWVKDSRKKLLTVTSGLKAKSDAVHEAALEQKKALLELGECERKFDRADGKGELRAVRRLRERMDILRGISEEKNNALKAAVREMELEYHFTFKDVLGPVAVCVHYPKCDEIAKRCLKPEPE
jgi:hypothetical protein